MSDASGSVDEVRGGDSKYRHSLSITGEWLIPHRLNKLVMRFNPIHGSSAIGRTQPEHRVAVFARVLVHEYDVRGWRGTQRVDDCRLSECDDLRGH
jgi:hypothetical protein